MIGYRGAPASKDKIIIEYLNVLIALAEFWFATADVFTHDLPKVEETSLYILNGTIPRTNEWTDGYSS